MINTLLGLLTICVASAFTTIVTLACTIVTYYALFSTETSLTIIDGLLSIGGVITFGYCTVWLIKAGVDMTKDLF